MKVRQAIASAATLAVMACGSAVWAADNTAAASNANSTPITANDLSLSAPVALDAAPAGPTTLTPLMYWLSGNSVGQTLSNWNINITGFVEGGYYYDTSAPKMSREEPTLIAFPGPYSNRGLLDQADLSISKTVDPTKSWDWGFLFENGYGTDDAYIHSSGLLDNRPPKDPQNQYDIVQANASLEIPGGVVFTAGKFVAILGEEVINPTGNLFYTHSYSFTYADPATNTGVLASYTWSKGWAGNPVTLTGGITRGWNQTMRDGNGAVDGIVELKVQPTSALSVTFNVEEGPEGNSPVHTNEGPFSANGRADNSDYWTTLEAIPSYTVSDQLTVSADCLYNDAPHDSYAQAGNSAQWYGVAAYASYKINPMFTANVRGEWFRDQGGAAVEGISANYYEATAGVQIKPFPTDNYLQWLQLRPEIREDWSDRPVFNFAHNGGVGDYSEFSVAMDAIMQF